MTLLRLPRLLLLLGASALLLWLAAGADSPWCLDNGLRQLAASSAAPTVDLGAVVNTAGGAPVFPDRVARTVFPVVEPFVHWQEGRPLLVFPALWQTLLWAFARLGALGPPLLMLLCGLLLAWAARRFLRREGADAHLWLAGLLASPVLFYLGTNWELPLAAALLLLLLQERRDPLPAALSIAYGLLPWLRPELALPWLGGLFLLQGWRRRALSLVGFAAGTLLNRSLTDSWLWLQVLQNDFQDWSPWRNLAQFWLPAAAGPWLWTGLVLLALLLWAHGRGGARERLATWLLWGAFAVAYAVTQTRGAEPLLPCWGALLTAPLAVAMLGRLLCREEWRGSGPEATLLLAFLLVVSVASPLSRGFHWGPRLLVPALLPLGLWFVTREPAGWPRRLALGLALGAQAISLLLLGGRRQLVAAQDEALAGLRAPAVVTSEFYLLGDHPQLARGRLCYLPWGELPARALVEGLRGHGVAEIDLLCPPGHPLPVFLERQLELCPLAPPLPLPGGRLGHAMEWRRLGL